MLQQTLRRIATGAACALAMTAVAGEAVAIPTTTYDVTITNLTKGQVFSPPLVAFHSDAVTAFEIGQPASTALEELAEDGMSASLETAITNAGGMVEVAGAPLPPGQSVTIPITASDTNMLLSVLGMLVTTNDAFFALNGFNTDGAELPLTFYVPAYDAGSEDNNELCKFIPGPPCGNTNVRDTNGAEGFVHVHNGIHGILSFGNRRLKSSRDDWRNPVARIVVRMADL